MLIKEPTDIASSEITPKKLYLNRRKLLVAVSAMAGVAALGGMAACQAGSPTSRVALTETDGVGAKIDDIQKSPLSTVGEKFTPLKDITNYNNYYEFSTDKYEPAGLAKDFTTRRAPYFFAAIPHVRKLHRDLIQF